MADDFAEIWPTRIPLDVIGAAVWDWPRKSLPVRHVRTVDYKTL